MKATKRVGLVLAALAFVAVGAQAQETAGLTREQVRAELFAAQKAGQEPYGFAAGLTKAQVQGAGEAAAGVVSPKAMAAVSGGKTRAEVRAELKAADAAEDVPVGFAAMSVRDVYWGGKEPADVAGHFAHAKAAQ